MSYCRWSSECFNSDLYIYEDTFGSYWVHLADFRYLSEEPRPVLPNLEGLSQSQISDAYRDYLRKSNSWIKTAVLQPIGLSCTEECFCTSTLEELLDKVKELKELGYIIPDYVIPTIEEDIEINNSKEVKNEK